MSVNPKFDTVHKVKIAPKENLQTVIKENQVPVIKI